MFIHPTENTVTEGGIGFEETEAFVNHFFLLPLIVLPAGFSMLTVR